jgi:hypothetical protein
MKLLLLLAVLSLLAYLLSRFSTPADEATTAHTISPSNRRHIARLELGQGWDGPVWRTPKEIAKMRRAERQQASPLRMVKTRRG